MKFSSPKIVCSIVINLIDRSILYGIFLPFVSVIKTLTWLVSFLLLWNYLFAKCSPLTYDSNSPATFFNQFYITLSCFFFFCRIVIYFAILQYHSKNDGFLRIKSRQNGRFFTGLGAQKRCPLKIMTPFSPSLLKLFLGCRRGCKYNYLSINARCIVICIVNRFDRFWHPDHYFQCLYKPRSWSCVIMMW